jgi:hypothetical protein
VGVFAAIMIAPPRWGDAKIMSIRAQEGMLIGGTDVLYYKAQHGEWPERLEQIQHYLPIDPFTGRPLKYRRIPDGFVIYSLGESGRDDGGQIPRPGTLARDWKAVFRYPAPPRRPYPTPTSLPAQKPS